jgi:hypothetical protein
VVVEVVVSQITTTVDIMQELMVALLHLVHIFLLQVVLLEHTFI